MKDLLFLPLSNLESTENQKSILVNTFKEIVYQYRPGKRGLKELQLQM